MSLVPSSPTAASAAPGIVQHNNNGFQTPPRGNRSSLQDRAVALPGVPLPVGIFTAAAASSSAATGASSMPPVSTSRVQSNPVASSEATSFTLHAPVFTLPVTSTAAAAASGQKRPRSDNPSSGVGDSAAAAESGASAYGSFGSYVGTHSPAAAARRIPEGPGRAPLRRRIEETTGTGDSSGVGSTRSLASPSPTGLADLEGSGASRHRIRGSSEGGHEEAAAPHNPNLGHLLALVQRALGVPPSARPPVVAEEGGGAAEADPFGREPRVNRVAVGVLFNITLPTAGPGPGALRIVIPQAAAAEEAAGGLVPLPVPPSLVPGGSPPHHPAADLLNQFNGVDGLPSTVDSDAEESDVRTPPTQASAPPSTHI